MNWLDDFTEKNSIWHFEFQSEENVENLKRFIYTKLPLPTPPHPHHFEFFFCVCKAWSIKRQERNVKHISQHLSDQMSRISVEVDRKIRPFGFAVSVKRFYAKRGTLSFR
jgi:hypothetical protein